MRVAIAIFPEFDWNPSTNLGSFRESNCCSSSSRGSFEAWNRLGFSSRKGIESFGTFISSLGISVGEENLMLSGAFPKGFEISSSLPIGTSGIAWVFLCEGGSIGALMLSKAASSSSKFFEGFSESVFLRLEEISLRDEGGLIEDKIC